MTNLLVLVPVTAWVPLLMAHGPRMVSNAGWAMAMQTSPRNHRQPITVPSEEPFREEMSEGCGRPMLAHILRALLRSWMGE